MAITESVFGVEGSMQMLQFREQLKGQMSEPEYLEVMKTHKASIQSIMESGPTYAGREVLAVEAAEIIVNLLDADASLDDDQREMWKACIVVAAFEMSEF